MTNHQLLCSSADEVSANWMERALAEGGSFESPVIEHIEIVELGAATNAFGSILRCHLYTADHCPDIPETVIVKLPVSSRMGFKFAKWLSLHKREYDYYRHVAQHTSIRSPSLLYGDLDNRDHRFVLVMEDLRTMETTSELEGVTDQRARRAISEVARLHGQFWDTEDHTPVSGSFDTTGAGYGRFMQVAYLLCLGPALDRFSELFSPVTRRLAEDFGARIVAHYTNVATGPKTFVHGDFRAQNLFFGVDPEDSFAAIDWQGSGLGSGLYDVAYFLGASVSVDVRRRIERETLEEYYAIVRGMGADRFTFADCWRSYRQNMLSALVPIVLACGLLNMSDPKQRDLAEAGLCRVLTAIEDLDAREFLPAREKFWTAGAVFSNLSIGGYKAYTSVQSLSKKARQLSSGRSTTLT